MNNSQQAKLLPCPHCGSTDIRTDPIMFSDDDGEHAGVECMDCDAIARYERWNQRQQPTVVPSKEIQKNLRKVCDWLKASLSGADWTPENAVAAQEAYIAAKTAMKLAALQGGD